MWEQILPGLRIKLFLTVVLGIIYPLAITAISQMAFPDKANGSLVQRGDKSAGSELIGQNFTRPEYFHPRPSAAGNGYDAASSGASNLGPTSAKLFDAIALRIIRYCVENEIPYTSSIPVERLQTAKGDLDDAKIIKALHDAQEPLVFTPKLPIPADAVTASASGLDPHISPESARMQTARVAKARGVPVDRIQQIVDKIAERPTLGLLGEPRVNVLRLNLALDESFPIRR